MKYRIADWNAQTAELVPGDMLVLDLYAGGVCKRRAVAVILPGERWGAFIGAGSWDPIVIAATGSPLHCATARFLFPRWFSGGCEYTEDLGGA